MPGQITDMETWLLDGEGRIFRYQVYRRMFTPYEQQMRFMDESQFENGTYFEFGMIKEAVELGGGEWLLGFRQICDEELTDEIVYYRLSEIRLYYFDTDQNMLEEAEDEINELE